jgi:hypothetical protein
MLQLVANVPSGLSLPPPQKLKETNIPVRTEGHHETIKTGF